jgi:SNF2 family DNA or RNA helicase
LQSVAAAAGKMAGAREKAAEERHSFKQPAMLTGGQLKPYQLDGVQWLASLFSQGSTIFFFKMNIFHHTLLLQ